MEMEIIILGKVKLKKTDIACFLSNVEFREEKRT
jgi:hypothetical protein